MAPPPHDMAEHRAGAGESELDELLAGFVAEARAMLREGRVTEGRAEEVGEVLDAALTRLRRLLRD